MQASVLKEKTTRYFSTSLITSSNSCIYIILIAACIYTFWALVHIRHLVSLAFVGRDISRRRMLIGYIEHFESIRIKIASSDHNDIKDVLRPWCSSRNFFTASQCSEKKRRGLPIHLRKPFQFLSALIMEQFTLILPEGKRFLRKDLLFLRDLIYFKINFTFHSWRYNLGKTIAKRTTNSL